MALRLMIGALVVLICVRPGHGMVNKCLKVLANQEFHTDCSVLQGNHVRPCLVKTQKDADVLVGAQVIGGGTPIPVNHICAARQELREADCVSVHVRPDPQQTWQWTEWRENSAGIVRNFVISEGGTDYTCPYEEKYTGPVYPNCHVAYLHGERTSGVYTILPDPSTVMNVYCEQELHGGGWTVLQKRLTGEVDFYRTWDEYKAGFGNTSAEHWVGNDNLHALTKDQLQHVMFQLDSLDGETAHAVYFDFWIENENGKYRLHIGDFSGDDPPGDSMITWHNNRLFSTKDQDNDGSGLRCAIDSSGGWWYNYPCHHSHLNGVYGSTESGKGITWNSWKGSTQSLASTVIMVKPVYVDCLDAYNHGMHTSGVYVIRPDGVTKMDVYCEMELGGGGFTVFQMRNTGDLDFYRTWAEYKAGFGDTSGEHWLGNDKLHALTKNQNQQLMIELGTAEGETATAIYDLFWIEDENANYLLHVGHYSGGAAPGDSLSQHSGLMFSTKDQDNDPWSGHCAQSHLGGWWYGTCHQSNLNGLYGSADPKGLNWFAWKEHDVSMTSTTMMIKQVYIDCVDVYNSGVRTSGVYTIRPDGITNMDVFCNQEVDGGGWVVFQMRNTGDLDFYRTWAEYKAGFGNISGEHWLGTDKLHALTKDEKQQLTIELGTAEGETATAVYDLFWIEDENANYLLHIGQYSGGAPPGDSLSHHSGLMFSTKDQDNDPWIDHCAQSFVGGWWYGTCHEANLNGLYGSADPKGLNWVAWKGYYVSMAYTAMMIKPVYDNCVDAYNHGRHTSGVYTIRPDGVTKMDVYCEMDLDGGGWAVFQRRQTGVLSFFQNWDEYRNGFGDINGEHWLGNDKIHLLTKDQDQKVMFHLRSQNMKEAFAKYSSFWLEDESQKFRLHIAGYSGDAVPGDSMTVENGMQFSTLDSDNDAQPGGCSLRWYGAWWYQACFSSNLNGKWATRYGGVCWNSWKGIFHYLTYTSIMVKPNT